MDHLLSYCGLVDAKISASEKDLPALYIFGVKMAISGYSRRLIAKSAKFLRPGNHKCN